MTFGQLKNSYFEECDDVHNSKLWIVEIWRLDNWKARTLRNAMVYITLNCGLLRYDVWTIEKLVLWGMWWCTFRIRKDDRYNYHDSYPFIMVNNVREYSQCHTEYLTYLSTLNQLACKFYSKVYDFRKRNYSFIFLCSYYFTLEQYSLLYSYGDYWPQVLQVLVIG